MGSAMFEAAEHAQLVVMRRRGSRADEKGVEPGYAGAAVPAVDGGRPALVPVSPQVSLARDPATPPRLSPSRQ